MIEVTDQLVSVVSAQLDDVDDTLVTRVLTALNFVYEGPSVGTVLQNTDTGEIAHRIAENGVITWRVTKTNGEVWGAHPATLPGSWTTLYTPPVPAEPTV